IVLSPPWPEEVMAALLRARPSVWQPLVDWGLLRCDALRRSYWLDDTVSRYAARRLDPGAARRATLERRLCAGAAEHAAAAARPSGDGWAGRRGHVLAWARTPDPETAARMAADDPDLVSPLAQSLLAQVAADLADQAGAWDELMGHITLIDRCREIGVAAAFGERERAAAGPSS